MSAASFGTAVGGDEQSGVEGGWGIGYRRGEIGVLLEIAEKKKRGFVSKEKELNVYRKADSDSEDSELSSSSSSSSDGDVDDFVPGEDEGVLYSTLGAETFASRNFREFRKFCPNSRKFKTRKILY